MPKPANKNTILDAENQEEQRPSRSAKKRACTALQKLGEELAKLPAQKRNGLSLPDELKEALDHYDTITDHEGRRRQRQFIGRIMREVDADDIARQLGQLE